MEGKIQYEKIKYTGVSVSGFFGYRDPRPCSDTEVPWNPNFDNSYPNSDTETPLLVIHYQNIFFLN